MLRADLAMAARAYNVLFLCSHNSARSVMAEVIINYVGRGKFKGYSAGSHPATAPNPFSTDFPGNASDFRTMMRLPHRWAVVMAVAWSWFAREG